MINLLNRDYIQSALLCGEALVFDEINSTNEYLLSHCKNLKSGTVCLAESQSKGRGRRGRQWYSPLGQNLYFSLLWKYSVPKAELQEKLASLSLVVAVIIAETFTELGVKGIQIKWPNDIYYQSKKMGGILIESKIDRTGIDIIIGIGLNLSMNTIDPKIVDQPWADLNQFHFDRNKLCAELTKRLQQMLFDYPNNHLENYLVRWQAFDCFYQKKVKLVNNQTEIQGVSQGINTKGELLLDIDGIIQAFSIGELSLRSN